MKRASDSLDSLQKARSSWVHTGRARPPFAITPGPGQESVWDYPRPPVVVSDSRVIEVRIGDVLVARSHHALRVLETASPPTFYLPPDSVLLPLVRMTGQSQCEWKGRAIYWGLTLGETLHQHVAWSYPAPSSAFRGLAHHYAFYPSRSVCTVDGVRVVPQPGRFYGGWITPDVVGPFKGDPGTSGW